MKNISIFCSALCLLLTGCAATSAELRTPASAQPSDTNPANYNIFCGALMPASQHFELSILQGTNLATIHHNASGREVLKQEYTVKLSETNSAYIFSGGQFELKMVKSEYDTNGKDILVPSHL
jgi:hypothetical protein